MKRIILLSVFALAGCGSSTQLKPPPGATLPVAPYGAVARPDAAALTTPTTEQRPERADELLTKSEARRSDEFDLPPPTRPPGD